MCLVFNLNRRKTIFVIKSSIPPIYISFIPVFMQILNLFRLITNICSILYMWFRFFFAKQHLVRPLVAYSPISDVARQPTSWKVYIIIINVSQLNNKQFFFQRLTAHEGLNFLLITDTDIGIKIEVKTVINGTPTKWLTT